MVTVVSPVTLIALVATNNASIGVIVTPGFNDIGRLKINAPKRAKNK